MVHERETGILTDRQRKWLAGELDDEIEAGSSTERNMRRRILHRIFHGLLDGTLLLRSEKLEEEHRAKIFDPTQPPDFLGPVDDKGLFLEVQTLEKQISKFLAFLYIGLAERDPEHVGSDFGEILKDAHEGVETQTGWRLQEFEYTAEFDRGPDTGAIVERFEHGEVSEEEAIWLLRQELIEPEEFSEYFQENPDKR